MSLSLTLFGQTTTPSVTTTAERHTLVDAAVGSVVFGLIGIALLLIGYFVFDLLARRIDIQEQLNKGNTAVAIVVGALLLAIAYIAAHVVL
jgi:putative membrane protein